MPVPAQQNAEIVEPGHDTLQFDPVDQEDREGDLVLSNVVEKRVLKVLRAIARHGSCLASPPPPVLAVGQPT
jgi:sorbitol-specific phosphotransferase system component IIA